MFFVHTGRHGSGSSSSEFKGDEACESSTLENIEMSDIHSNDPFDEISDDRNDYIKNGSIKNNDNKDGDNKKAEKRGRSISFNLKRKGKSKSPDRKKNSSNNGEIIANGSVKKTFKNESENGHVETKDGQTTLKSILKKRKTPDFPDETDYNFEDCDSHSLSGSGSEKSPCAEYDPDTWDNISQHAIVIDGQDEKEPTVQRTSLVCANEVSHVLKIFCFVCEIKRPARLRYHSVPSTPPPRRANFQILSSPGPLGKFVGQIPEGWAILGPLILISFTLLYRFQGINH